MASLGSYLVRDALERRFGGRRAIAWLAGRLDIDFGA